MTKPFDVAAASAPIAALIERDTARTLFRQLLRIRLVEERIAELYVQEQLMRCPTHFSVGQEAIAVGVCAQLKPQELMTSAHRNHAHYLAKGGDLRAMVAELYGKVTGCARGKGGSMHLIDQAAGFLGAVPIVGGTIPIGVGAAFASVLQNDPCLCVIFFGDGATESGIFHESLNFAALHRLPVVMVCENNLLSVNTYLEPRQPAGREIIELARAQRVPAWQGDGNDVEEVYRLTGAAVALARSGQGPAFLEFKTYRLLEHCGPLDDCHLGYRSKEELDSWKRRDPVVLYRESLLGRGMLTAAEVQQFTDDIRAEMDDAVAFARSSPFPPKEELLYHVFAD